MIREDAHLLFGFISASDRELFRSLLKISGVGPKVALAILSSVSAADFALMVESGDSQALTRLPGIGKKTAERLILEMKSRLDGLELGSGGSTGAGQPDTGERNASGEARAGLIALGYSPAEALKMIKGVGDDSASAEAMRAHPNLPCPGPENFPAAPDNLTEKRHNTGKFSKLDRQAERGPLDSVS